MKKSQKKVVRFTWFLLLMCGEENFFMKNEHSS